ncbi:MAG: hypothetical protein Kow0092_01370 [Deferrisomatales bacterium]
MEARRRALEDALSRAVSAVVERYVPAAELRARRDELAGSLLRPPRSFVLRYGIVRQLMGPEEVRVVADVEVDRARLLSALEAHRVAVVRLGARPRLLIVPTGGDLASRAAKALGEILEEEGFRSVRRAIEGEADVQDAALAAWAWGEGCHLALAVAAEAAADPEAPDPGEGAVGGPAPSAVRATVRGRLIDARSGWVVGQRQVVVAVEADEGGEPAAGEEAGRRLAAPVLADLEQSGWSLEGPVAQVDLRVEGVPDPAALEAVGRELRALTEVRRVALREVGYRSALWRLEVIESGFGWDALLAATRLEGAALEIRGESGLDGSSDVPVVQAAWVAR